MKTNQNSSVSHQKLTEINVKSMKIDPDSSEFHQTSCNQWRIDENQSKFIKGSSEFLENKQIDDN